MFIKDSMVLRTYKYTFTSGNTGGIGQCWSVLLLFFGTWNSADVKQNTRARGRTMDTLHMAFTIAELWHYLIEEFGNYSALFKITWYIPYPQLTVFPTNVELLSSCTDRSHKVSLSKVFMLSIPIHSISCSNCLMYVPHHSIPEQYSQNI